MNSSYIIILSLIGFLISFYIYYTKAHNKNLYCPIGTDCDAVVRSRYGKSFGIENTIPGMAYYLLVLAYGILGFANRILFNLRDIFIY